MTTKGAAAVSVSLTGVFSLDDEPPVNSNCELTVGTRSSSRLFFVEAPFRAAAFVVLEYYEICPAEAGLYITRAVLAPASPARSRCEARPGSSSRERAGAPGRACRQNAAPINRGATLST